MKSRTTAWVALVLALLAVLVLGACGGDSDDTTSSTTTTTAKAADVAEQPAGDDQALADAALLKLADFGAGWEATEKDADGTPDAGTPLEGCFAAEGAQLEAAQSAEATSPDFNKGETMFASSFSIVTKTEDDAEEGFALFRSGNLTTCMEAELKKTIPPGTGASTSVKELAFPDVGSDSVAYELLIAVTAPEMGEIKIYADLIFVRNGRALTTAFFYNVNEPPAPKEQEEAVKKLAARLAAS